MHSPSPVVIFWALESPVWPFVGKLMEELQRQDVNSDLKCRVKDGLLLMMGEDTVERHYSARRDGVRILAGWRQEAEPFTEVVGKEMLYEGLTFLHRNAQLTQQSLYGIRYFCTVFSSVLPQRLLSAIEASGIGAQVSGLAEVDRGNEFCFDGLWGSMLPRFIITDGQILEALQESMLDFGMSGDFLLDSDAVLEDEGTWSPSGYFSEEFPGFIIVQERFASLSIPVDWVRPRSRPVRSPVGYFMDQLPSRITKINKNRDDPDRPGSFRLDDPRFEWPELDQVRAKVRGYCLNTQHVEKKWLGFRKLGYSSDVEGHDIHLAASLCSALMKGSFRAYDMKVGADGTGEFVVYVLLAGPSDTRFLPVTTAWNIQRDKSLALSSAYVGTIPADRECAVPMTVDQEWAETEPWRVKFDWVLDAAAQYSSSMAFDGRQGRGWLWLPHDTVLAKEFATWYQREFDANVFRRKKFGGKATLASLGLTITNIRIIAATLRMAQICLGLLEISTYVEVEYD